MESVLGPPPRYGIDYAFHFEVPRQSLGLDLHKKPGDIDVLIIPWTDEGPLLDFTMAIELKKLNILAGREDRSINSYGTTQCSGLLADGFPCVGLLHLIVIEPDPNRRKTKSSLVKVVDAEVGLVEPAGSATVDTFTTTYGERQLGRLCSMSLPDEVGRNAVLLTLDSDGKGFGTSIGNNVQARPRKQMSEDLRNRLGDFLLKGPDPSAIYFQAK